MPFQLKAGAFAGRSAANAALVAKTASALPSKNFFMQRPAVIARHAKNPRQIPKQF
jgi:hypothetical protein